MSIFDGDDDGSTNSTNYTSGKKVIPLAICPDVKETYQNIKLLFDLINIQLLDKFTLTGDLKCLNIIIIGIFYLYNSFHLAVVFKNIENYL